MIIAIGGRLRRRGGHNLWVASPDALTDAGVSAREAEVLELVAQRATNAEIAARLFVSVRTVESHVSSLLRKLGVPDRRSLARLASQPPGGDVPRADRDGRDRAGGSDDYASTPGGAAPVRPARALPVPLTSFVGRAAETAQLAEAVAGHRLVTATGPGGVGKTRLATAVAADLSAGRGDGAWFVDLVPVGDDALIATAVGTTLGLDVTPDRAVEDQVIERLAGSDALLVLDNCEHLAAGVAVFVERLLGRCPHVTVLATSQARLMLPFEWVFPVPGLSLPDHDDEGDAVALFVERARQAGVADIGASDQRRIGEICRRLDGGALAIELAAARLPSLGLDGIERGLSERFRLLAGGSRIDERHQSLRSTIDWSYGLLSPTDQALLRRLSVFASPFTVAAADVVAGFAPLDQAALGDGLARLAEHSLVVTSPGAETRYRLLETIRQYGTERMCGVPVPEAEMPVQGRGEGGVSRDEHEVVRRRHLRWAADVMGRLDARIDLPLRDVLPEADLRAWRDDFDHAADDARAALKWARPVPGMRSGALALAGLLASTCFSRGLLAECQMRYEQAAELTDDGFDRAEMLMCAAGGATARQVGNDALRLWRAAADVAQGAGDPGTAAYALARSAELVLRGPGIIAERPPRGTHDELIAEAQGLSAHDPRADAAILTSLTFGVEETDPEAVALAERALAAARALADPLIESAALDSLTAVHLGHGDVAAALDAVHRRIELVSQVRPSVLSAFEIADAYTMATEVSLTAGDFDAARRYADALARFPFHNGQGHLATSRRLRVEALTGELDRVLADGGRFRHGWEQAGRPMAKSLASGAYAVAMAHGLRGDEAARATWAELTLLLGQDPDWLEGCQTGYAPTFDAIVLLHHGDPVAALGRLFEDPSDFRRWYTGEWRPWYAALRAEAAVLAGDAHAREHVERARPIVASNPSASAMVDRAAALAAGEVGRLATVADVLAAEGCRYQWARTLILAGGELATEGRRQMAALGAAPMAEPPFT